MLPPPPRHQHSSSRSLVAAVVWSCSPDQGFFVPSFCLLRKMFCEAVVQVPSDPLSCPALLCVRGKGSISRGGEGWRRENIAWARVAGILSSSGGAVLGGRGGWMLGS